MSDILPMIQSIKPPKPSADFDSTIMYEAEQACPGLAYYAQQENQDPWMKGLILSLYSIYSSLSDVGQEEIVTELTVEFLSEIDNQLAQNAEDVLKDLPNVIEFMEKVETDNAFKAGVVCGFSAVLIATLPDEPTGGEQFTEVAAENTEGVGTLFEAEQPSETVETPPINDSIGVSFLLTRLYKMGMDIQKIHIRPFLVHPNPNNEKEVVVHLKITGPLGNAPDFQTVSKINSMFKSIGGTRDIQLTTETDDSNLWYEYVL